MGRHVLILRSACRQYRFEAGAQLNAAEIVAKSQDPPCQGGKLKCVLFSIEWGVKETDFDYYKCTNRSDCWSRAVGLPGCHNSTGRRKKCPSSAGRIPNSAKYIFLFDYFFISLVAFRRHCLYFLQLWASWTHQKNRAPLLTIIDRIYKYVTTLFIVY